MRNCPLLKSTLGPTLASLNIFITGDIETPHSPPQESVRANFVGLLGYQFPLSIVFRY